MDDPEICYRKVMADQAEDKKDIGQEVQWIERQKTECEHEWAYADPDPKSELISLACTKCWSGINVSKDSPMLRLAKRKQ